MSQSHVEAVLRGVEAMNRREPERSLVDIDDEVVWEPARAGVEGAFHGHDGMRRYWQDTAEHFDCFEVDYTDVRDLDDRVLAIGTVRARGREGGVEAVAPTAAIFTFRDDRLVHYKDYVESRAAFMAAGLSAEAR